MTYQDPLSGLPGIFQSQTSPYVSQNSLAAHLHCAGLIGTVGEMTDKTPFVILRRFINEKAPLNAIHLIVSPSGGETTQKTKLFADALAKELKREPAIAQTIVHLMCYAGRSSNGSPILLNVPKPVFGNERVSSLTLKTGKGGEEAHLVLNTAEAAQRFGGFRPIGVEELVAVTGMQPHAVNMLLSADRYDGDSDLRVIVCASLLNSYFSSSQTRAQFVELPLGECGDRFSVVLPLELFLAFLLRLRKIFPQVEIQDSGSIATTEISLAMKAVVTVLSPASLKQLLKYDPRRPVMASFNVFVGQLTKELIKLAPYLDPQTAKAMATNFVRHFFSVEHKWLTMGLIATVETHVEASYLGLQSTEYGSLLMPCESLEAFREKLKIERAKEQPRVPFEFSTEVAKSELYLHWLARMGETLDVHVMAVTRKGSSDPETVMSLLKQRLRDDCKSHGLQSGTDVSSLENTVSDFLGLFFGKLMQVIAKIDDKLAVILNPASAKDAATAAYWTEYWLSTTEMAREYQLAMDPTVIRIIVERAIASDVEILLELPFARQLFGDGRLIAAMVDRHLAADNKHEEDEVI